MVQKQSYISPLTTVVADTPSLPVMVTMTVYLSSPYTTLTTIEYGPQGYTSSDGSW